MGLRTDAGGLEGGASNCVKAGAEPQNRVRRGGSGMNIEMKDGPTMFMKTKGMTILTFAFFFASRSSGELLKSVRVVSFRAKRGISL